MANFLDPTCGSPCTCGTACSVANTFIPSPSHDAGFLTWTSSDTGPVTPPSCTPAYTLLSLYNALNGVPASPVLTLFNGTGTSGTAFNWTFLVTYNSITVFSDSGSFTTTTATDQ